MKYAYIAFVIAAVLTVTGTWAYAIAFLYLGLIAIGLFLLISSAVQAGIRNARRNQ